MNIINLQTTRLFKKLYESDKRIVVFQGGARSGKTMSILQYFIVKMHEEKNKVFTIARKTLPALRASALRDFIGILEKQGLYSESFHNKSELTYQIGSCEVEFISLDQPTRIRGRKRDYLFLNEVNEFTFEEYLQFAMRTTEKIVMDYNPHEEFSYIYDKIIPRDDTLFVQSTYLDNPFLEHSIIHEIEHLKQIDDNYWRVYGLGERGHSSAIIYTNWDLIDYFPECDDIVYGVDFGFNNPSAIVKVGIKDQEIFIHEELYQSNLTNQDLIEHAKLIITNMNSVVKCDSAEPDRITEFCRAGFNAQPCQKGKNSVKDGIDVIKRHKLHITKSSLNVIKEIKNYKWKIDKDEHVLEEPVPFFNHCFAPETLIHTTKGKKRIDELVGKEGYLYSRDGRIERFFDVKETRKDAEVIKLIFNDGDSLTVTPDHLLLLPNGNWIESSLLNVNDMIQSVIYENTNIQWARIPSIFWGKVLQSWKESTAQSGMGILQWEYSEGIPYPSQGYESIKQFNREPGVANKRGTFSDTLHGIFEKSFSDRKKEKALQFNKTSNKEVALIQRGNRVAQITWNKDVQQKSSNKENMLSLSYRILHNAICKIRAFLQSKLQDESPSKKIVRITRGFRSITYNLEVENTHCLLANGVIAHNSMDAVRYAYGDMMQLVPNMIVI